MGDFKKWEDLSNGGMILKWRVDTTLRTTGASKYFTWPNLIVIINVKRKHKIFV